MRPTPITSGTTIGIFAPSEPITGERYACVQNGIRILESHGYLAHEPTHLRAKLHYAAGSTAERVSDINELLRSDSIGALMAAWGGKSAAHLLPELDYSLISSARKPILAHSDGGVLLNAIYARTGLITFYGPNVVGKLDQTEYSSLALLHPTGLRPGIQLFSSSGPFATIQSGQANGPIIAANLSTYVLGISGTRFEPNCENAIFAWESGPKSLQDLDNLLYSLRLRGLFDMISGMIVGHVEVKSGARWGGPELPDLIRKCVGRPSIPILYAPVFGHGKLPNPILPIGAHGRLNADSGELVLTSC